MYSKQRGNILFLILLAVVLFAALSYAVTSNERGQVKSASNEKISSMAAEIVQYASLLENTSSRLRLVNGCTDTQISFENTTTAGFTNPNAPIDKRCNVFDPAGGGMNYKPKIPDEFIQPTGWLVNATTTGWYNNYAGRSVFVPSQAVGTSAQDLSIVIPFIKPSLCLEINRQLNGASSIAIDSVRAFFMDWTWRGTYNNSEDIGFSSPYDSGCARKTGDNIYYFYKVIISR